MAATGPGRPCLAAPPAATAATTSVPCTRTPRAAPGATLRLARGDDAGIVASRWSDLFSSSDDCLTADEGGSADLRAGATAKAALARRLRALADQPGYCLQFALTAKCSSRQNLLPHVHINDGAIRGYVCCITLSWQIPKTQWCDIPPA